MIEEKKFIKDQWLQLFFAASIIFLSFILTPSNSEDDRAEIFGYKTPILCLHRLMFNQPCAGCGMTRSFVNIAHGNIKKAYSYHKIGIPLFLVILLQIPIRIYLLIIGSKGYTNFIQKLISIPAIACVIALIMNWVYFQFQLFLSPNIT